MAKPRLHFRTGSFTSGIYISEMTTINAEHRTAPEQEAAVQYAIPTGNGRKIAQVNNWR